MTDRNPENKIDYKPSLQYGYTYMKTTLNISDVTMLEIKREAARRRQTMSELVEAALRAIIQPEERVADLPPLPEFSGGGLRVNVANRDALCNVMES